MVTIRPRRRNPPGLFSLRFRSCGRAADAVGLGRLRTGRQVGVQCGAGSGGVQAGAGARDRADRQRSQACAWWAYPGSGCGWIGWGSCSGPE
jgi:hypothetical protein